MQLASRNPFLRTACCWLGNFLQGFLGHSLQNALWLSPTPLQNFHGTFAELRRPQPSAGGASKEKQTTGALVFGSGKASLLEAWLLHLGFVSWDFRNGYQCQPEIKFVKTIHGTMPWSYPCKELPCTMHLYIVLMVNTFAGSDVGTLEAFAIKNPYMDL